MNYEQEMLSSLGEILAIESVAYVNCSETAPYGAGPAAALDYMLKLCSSLGFRVKNCNNQLGWAEIGEGDEMVGILCHLDVVPAGEGWDYEPYALTLVGDRAYGRGVTDDKGPAICCIYAMKELLDAGYPLKRRIRIIFGLCEEVGDWPDMAYYRAHEELPTFGFTPDANYPPIYGEKGILSVALRMPLAESGLLDAAGGTAVNVVPPRCSVTYAGPDGQPVTLRAEGVPAHSSTPELGKNAISAAMEQLAAVPGIRSSFLDFYQKHIGWDYHGSKMGCGFEDDKSGKLTLNAGVLAVEGEDLVLSLNLRIPVTFTRDDALAAIRAAAEPYGMSVSVLSEIAPIYLDKNGPLVTTLLEVYRENTGDTEHQPIVIGGGTYARAMPNVVAFGPMIPGREITAHMFNEYALVDDLFLNRTIYRKTMEKLAGEL